MSVKTGVENLRALVREVPNYPSQGILFYDITTLLRDAEGFRAAVDLMTSAFPPESVDVVAAMESRGFIFGAPLAYMLSAGFVPIRKLGKLPAATITRNYQLEYGTNSLEIHTDAIVPGQRVLLVDDVLATGGTVAASLELVEEAGGIPIGVAVLAELVSLKGRSRLAAHNVDVVSFITF